MSDALSSIQKELATRGVVFTVSGMRGIVGTGITPELLVRATVAYGSWYREHGDLVIVGRDTRLSGPWMHQIVVGSLMACGCKVLDLGVCPTPAIIFTTRIMNATGAIIISGSHNPPEWNAIKCLDPDHTFLSNEELEHVARYMSGTTQPRLSSWQESGRVEGHNPIPAYFKAIKTAVDPDIIAKAQPSVIIDTGAGAGRSVTPKLLEILGCRVKTINNDLLPGLQFPRNIEPIASNLGDLSKAVHEGGADVGFAHDCDADRVALVSEKGVVYPEDIILALIVKEYLERLAAEKRRGIIVTNIASSLMFDELAVQYNGKVIHTPVGERYLASKMQELLPNLAPTEEVFGGEGSCGGFMLPKVNNTRDGILAAAKVVEILARRKKKISELVAELPHFDTARETFTCPIEASDGIMDTLKTQLRKEGVIFSEIDRDVRIVGKNEWILIHPSNTEPIIRVITEAKTTDRARTLCDEYGRKMKVCLQ
jgi:phosphoglucosamine mutase